MLLLLKNKILSIPASTSRVRTILIINQYNSLTQRAGGAPWSGLRRADVEKSDEGRRQVTI